MNIRGACEIDLWCNQRDVEETTSDAAMNVLSEDERLRAGRLRDAVQRQRWVASRWFLRAVLSQYVDERPEEIRIGKLPQGKPFLIDHPSLHYSLSHSGELTVVAVTSIGPLGVDVESIQPMAELIGAMTISMTPREQAVLDSLPERERPDWFLHGWTCKEAILKATGNGIDDQLLRLEVSLDSTNPEVVRRDGRATDGWAILPFEPCPGYRGTVAIECFEPSYVRLVQKHAGSIR